MNCKQFCTLELSAQRDRLNKIPDLKVKLKGMYIDPPSKGAGKEKYFFVRLKDSTVLWEGYTCCAYSARSKAIERLIEKHKVEVMEINKMFNINHLLKRGGRVRRHEMKSNRYDIIFGDTVIGYSVRVGHGFEIQVVVTANKYVYHECKLTPQIETFFRELGDLAFEANEERCKLARISAGKVFDHDQLNELHDLIGGD